MTNGAKTTALTVIAGIALAGLCASLGLAWHASPIDTVLANNVVLTLKDICLLIVGHLSGSSRPDGEVIPPGTTQQITKTELTVSKSDADKSKTE